MRVLKTLTYRSARFIVLMAMLTMAFTVITPNGESHACLPCACPVANPPINCYGPYSVYTVTRSDGTCAIVVFALDENSNGIRVISQSARRLALVPAFPPENVLLAKNDTYKIYLYKLTSGEYQVNVGPDREAKVFQVRWTGCPANISGRNETTWVATN
ncbi:MAG: hypothetical protein CUN52_13500 [Phototrophicales bacterium]|jgi:hypothetical protein|nr:MAG: hypothetical protein CUN52_13500 [Phototrophicales bacterium]